MSVSATLPFIHFQTNTFNHSSTENIQLLSISLAESALCFTIANCCTYSCSRVDAWFKQGKIFLINGTETDLGPEHSAQGYTLRIIELLRLEDHLKITKSNHQPNTDKSTARLHPYSTYAYLQRWQLHHFLGQPAPMLNYPL